MPELRETADRSGRLRARREATRAGILQGARACFARLGYANTTVEDILQASQVSRATFYFYFESKQALLISLVEELEPGLLNLCGRIAPLPAASPEGVRRWLDELLDFLSRHQEVLNIWGTAVSDPLFARWLLTFAERLASRLGIASPSNLQAEGTAARRGAVASSLFFAQLGHFCSLAVPDNGLVGRAELVDVMSEMMFAVLPMLDEG